MNSDEPQQGAHWSFMAGATEHAASMRRELRRILMPCADQDGYDDAVLAAHELVSNALEYGRGTVLVTLVIEGKCAIISVESEGDAFGLPEDGALESMDPLAPSGRGLIIARALCPDISVSRVGNRTTVIATLPISLIV